MDELHLHLLCIGHILIVLLSRCSSNYTKHTMYKVFTVYFEDFQSTTHVQQTNRVECSRSVAQVHCFTHLPRMTVVNRL